MKKQDLRVNLLTIEQDSTSYAVEYPRAFNSDFVGGCVQEHLRRSLKLSVNISLARLWQIKHYILRGESSTSRNCCGIPTLRGITRCCHVQPMNAVLGFFPISLLPHDLDYCSAVHSCLRYASAR